MIKADSGRLTLMAMAFVGVALALPATASARDAARLVTRTVRSRRMALKPGGKPAKGPAKADKTKAGRSTLAATLSREDWLVAPVAKVGSGTAALLLSRMTLAPKIVTARLEHRDSGWAPVGSSVALGEALTRRLDDMGGVEALLGDLQGVLPKTALKLGETRVIKADQAKRFWSPGRFDRVKLTLIGAPRAKDGRRVVGLQLHLDRFGDKGFTTLDLRGQATLAGRTEQVATLRLSGLRVTRNAGAPETRWEIELMQSARPVSAEDAKALREGRLSGLAAFGAPRAVRGESYRLRSQVRSVIDLGQQLGNDGQTFDVTQTVDLETRISKVRGGRAAEARVTIKSYTMEGNLPNNQADGLKGRAMVWKLSPDSEPVPADLKDNEPESAQVMQMTRGALPTQVFLDSLAGKRVKLGSTVRLSEADAKRLIFQQASVKVVADLTLESLDGTGRDRVAVFKAEVELKPGDGPNGVTGDMKGEVRIRVRDSRVIVSQMAGDLLYPQMPQGAKATIKHKTTIHYSKPAPSDARDSKPAAPESKPEMAKPKSTEPAPKPAAPKPAAPKPAAPKPAAPSPKKAPGGDRKGVF